LLRIDVEDQLTSFNEQRWVTATPVS
jgi:hypothetical protein